MDATTSVAGDEEGMVTGAGWRLQTYWPTQRNGELALVLATAGYDGMCRPWEFNGFMFYRGRFAGTLSPVNMRAREDGVLAQDVKLPSDHEVDAQYLRYALTDPLCCPSRGRTLVTFDLYSGAGASVMTPDGKVRIPPAVSGARFGLPRWGWLLALGIPLMAFVSAIGAVGWRHLRAWRQV